MTPEMLRDHVLGRASAEDHERIEEELLFAEDGTARVEAVRAALLESYLDGTLGPDERAAVDARLRDVPVWGEALDLLEALRAKADARPPDPALAPRGRRWVWGVAAGLVAALLALFVVRGPAPEAVRLDGRTMRADATVVELKRSVYGDRVPFVVDTDATTVSLVRGDDTLWTGALEAGRFEIPAEHLAVGLYEIELILEGEEPLARIQIRVR